MPTHDFIDIGDVLNHEFLSGTIESLDSGTDTCTVSVSGEVISALLFWHADPSDTLRDNGAIQGASGYFNVGDPVVVMRKIDGTGDVKVFTGGSQFIVKIAWKSVAANLPAAVTFCNDRINEMWTEKAMLTQFKDLITSDIVPYYETWRGKKSPGTPPVPISDAEIDNHIKLYTDWRDDVVSGGYTDSIAACDAVIIGWENTIKILQHIATGLYGKYTNHQNTNLDDNGHVLTGATPYTMNVVCKRVAPQPALDDTAAAALWNSITNPVLPEAIDVYLDNATIAIPYFTGLFYHIYANARGAIDSAGVFYFLAKDLLIDKNPLLIQSEPTEIKIHFWFTGETSSFYYIPYDKTYATASVAIKDGEGKLITASKTVNASLRGRRLVLYDEFGGVVDPITVDGNDVVLTWGGLRAWNPNTLNEYDTWMSRYLQVQADEYIDVDLLMVSASAEISKY